MVTARKKQTPQLVRVACMLTDQVGDAVYIRSNMNGAYKVARADISTFSKVPAIGVIIRKWDYTNALIQLSGELRDAYTGLIAGRTYFVGGDGKPSLLPPSPSLGGRAYVQAIGVAWDATVLFVEPSKSLVIRIG